MNLSAIPLLARASECPVGLSDHSLGTVAAVVAVTLGASLIEKHFTLDRSTGGVDSAFSLEPAELEVLVRDVRRAWEMRGSPSLGVVPAESANVGFRRSLYVVREVAEGELLTAENVRSIRPGHGLHPRFFDVVAGRRATQRIARGTPLQWDHVTR
jgi:N-acetylneuraminate synthase